MRGEGRRWGARGALALLGTLAALAVVAPASQAATFTVNQATDVADPTPGNGVCDVDALTLGDQCTVRAAFQTANGPDGGTADEIVLTLDVSLTIPGTNENNALNGDLDFVGGAGGGDLTVRSNVPGTVRQIDQNALERVITGSGGNLTLRDVELTGGTESTGASAAQGGGLLFFGAPGLTLRLDHARVVNNTATSTTTLNRGGGVFVTGAGATEIMNGTAIQNNVAGGTANNVQGQGGGIAFSGTGAGATTIADSTITGNRAGVGPTFTNMFGLGGGIYFQPAGTPIAPLTISNSDVDGNRAGGLGGSGLPSQGGGLHVETTDSTIPDVEITGGSFDGNFAGGGPGANGAPGGGDDPQGNGGGIRIASPNATVDLDGVSVIGNRAGGSDGVSNGTGNGTGAGISASGVSLTVEDSPLNDNLAGVASADNVSGSGGAIATDGAGTLTLDGATVDGNRAGANMQGGLGGGILAVNTGRMQLLDSVVTDNATRSFGGGVYRFRAAIGGLADAISDTRISDNTSGSAAGGLYTESDSDTLVSRSEVARNVASFGNGGGIQAVAEATAGGTPELIVENTTIDANDASGLDTSSRGGGLAVGFGNPNTVMDLTLRQSTITDNKVGTMGTSNGGNLFVEGDTADTASVDISGTIISGGSAGTVNPDCRFDFTLRAEVSYTSDGGNIQGPNSQGGTDCEFTNAAQGDLQNTALTLGAIASNGGPTQTRALPIGSVAVNNVPAALCAAITTDQRGYPRPATAGTNCDSGAYELFLCSGSPLNAPGPFTGCTPPAVVNPPLTPTPTTTTPQTTTPKKCKKGQKLRKGKCVKKKKKKRKKK